MREAQRLSRGRHRRARVVGIPGAFAPDDA
jgi:hypothetical protein